MILVFSGLLSTLTPELVEIKLVCPEGFTLMEIYDEETREMKWICNSYVSQEPPAVVEIR